MNRGVDLASLQASPWALSGFLRGIPPRALDEPPPAMQRPFLLDARQKAARQLRAILVEGIPPSERSPDPAAIHRAQALRSLGKECRMDEGVTRNLDLLFSVVGDTLPFLAAPEQAGLWQSPAWLACPPDDPLLRDALALADAVSRHDHAGVIRHGRALLDRQGTAQLTEAKQASRYIAGSMLMAALALGDRDQAMALYRGYWQKLPQSIREDDAIRLLLVLATTTPSRFGEGKVP